MSDQQAPAGAAARVVVQALAALGVRHVVLAPGSRSAPLALAVAEAALPVADPARDPRAPELELHVRVDERAAGFLALGLARAAAARREPRPVAVVTTSGTAPAHLLAAALEARHSGLPLVLITADRPHELRGTGANQTTDQAPLLAPAVRLALDLPAPDGRPGEDRDLRHAMARAVAAALGTRDHSPGPVHVNLAFREPLLAAPGSPWPEPGTAGLTEVMAHPGTPAGAQLAAYSDVARRQAAPDGVRTVVVAGDGAGPEATVVAHANDWPLLAEPSSGAGGGLNAIPAYRLLLDDPRLGGAVQRVVVLGRPTLSRPVARLLARPDVEVVVVATHGREWPDAGRNAARVLPGIPGELLRGNLGAGLGWVERWRTAGRVAGRAVADVLTAAGEATGPLVAGVVAASIGPQDVLVVGASNPIRDLDLVAAWEEPPLVVANRGLAGIDGTIATASGLALGLRHPVRAYLGDLAFLHDAGSLLVGPTERRPDLQVVVANDRGGSIFATLEQGAPELAHLATRVMTTPHEADLAALCQAYGVPHRTVAVDRLPAALREPVRGTSVLEVPVDGPGRRVLMERLAAAVTEAVAATTL